MFVHDKKGRRYIRPSRSGEGSGSRRPGYHVLNFPDLTRLALRPAFLAGCPDRRLFEVCHKSGE